MKRQDNQQKLAENVKPSKSPFQILDFFAKSTFLAFALTLLPIAGLVALWELNLTTTTVMISWVMFTLFWTFYVLLKLSKKFIE
ncbi:MAG: hypothetical protein M1503_12625 [Thaumarchaeota archaeon]|nr:hypothetical protein [Nitrososphaerota archaeon]MCL5319084.1 hypothetical protein [Nitrososphaerota archaeon]